MKSNLIVSSVLVFILVSGFAFGQSKPLSSGKNIKSVAQSSLSEAPFRYVIIAGTSEIELFVNDDNYVCFEVLMEERSFTEKNLIILYKLLDDRFKAKPNFSLHVTTTLAALRTPEEFDQLGLWGPVEDYQKYKFAFFHRSPSGKRINYSIPRKVRDKTVWIE